ncbi:ATP-binding protein [Actinoplanes sp. NEAU-A12]|uniref:ATP-binding protein n=1 Tax=Actinoplanes sandaracinus TaxID=3045177 RepID=A0ABT6WUL4_9ACTN|nr:ATP-binding protein [Actinoplanes sandaracinus]MDI6103437.1 ATP-binding protein [Actinoplanes sandaracinus]
MPSLELYTEDLLPVTQAARHARDVVTEACVRWDLDHLTGPATLIVSELVSNVVDHAHTMMTLEISRHDSFVCLTVRDGSSAPPIPRRDSDTTTPGGFGLRLVAFSSADWGWRPEPGGKAVWATLALDESAA